MKLAPALLKTDVCVLIAFGSFGDVIFSENHVLRYCTAREMKETPVPYSLGELFSILSENQLDNKCVKSL